MENRTLKVFLACALGAFVGTLIAIQLGPTFWFIGLLVGGLLGYLTFEVEKIPTAAKEAWRGTTTWKPDKAFWKYIGMGWVILALQVISLLANIYATNKVFSGRIGFGFFWADWFLLALPAGVLFTAMMIILSLIGIWDTPRTMTGEVDIPRRKLILKKYLWFTVGSTPLGLLIGYGLILPGILIRDFVMFIPDIAKGVQFIVKMAFKFLKAFFILIHSEDLRLLCSIDAAIGTSIGYWYHNPIIGAMAGGLFGIVSWEIISKRILKVAVARK